MTDSAEYKRLRRLANKRSHAISTWEKSPTRVNLDAILKLVRLFSNHIKNMGKK